jgi:hypothetical protein
MKTKDRINVRLEPHQIELLAEATKLLGNKMKESHVIRAALDHYFSCPESVLPNGKPLPHIVVPSSPMEMGVNGVLVPKRPFGAPAIPGFMPKDGLIRMKGSPEIRNPRKKDSEKASA